MLLKIANGIFEDKYNLQDKNVGKASEGLFDTPNIRAPKTLKTPIVKATKQTHNLGKGRPDFHHKDNFNSPYGGKE